MKKISGSYLPLIVFDMAMWLWLYCIHENC
jgi:hypothetical protein